MIRSSTRSDYYGEWLTLLLIAVCSLAIVSLAFYSWLIPQWVSILLLSVLLAFHSSLQHEVLHGHPFRNEAVNELLVCIPFGLMIPYRRFRTTHLQHHRDAFITDPYEDPESHYLDPAVWHRLTPFLQWLFRINGTLAGRILLGPAIALFYFYRSDLQSMISGDRSILRAYVLHGVGLLLWLVWFSSQASLPFWAYLLSAYMGLSLISVRAYLEHRAHERIPGRTVIVEGGGFFALLFLNNNLHLVHHQHPKAPWYRLPAMYRDQAKRFAQRNEGYVFSSYFSVFAHYLFRRKEPVAHPLWIWVDGHRVDEQSVNSAKAAYSPSPEQGAE